MSTIVVDASALLAVLLAEPDAAVFATALAEAGDPVMSVVNHPEAALRIDRLDSVAATRAFETLPRRRRARDRAGHAFAGSARAVGLRALRQGAPSGRLSRSAGRAGHGAQTRMSAEVIVPSIVARTISPSGPAAPSGSMLSTLSLPMLPRTT